MLTRILHRFEMYTICAAHVLCVYLTAWRLRLTGMYTLTHVAIMRIIVNYSIPFNMVIA